MKTCTKCKVSKVREEFNAKRASKDGLYPWCKQCVSQDRKDNRERENACWARWAKSNPDRIKAHVEKNKEKRALSSKKWKRENKAKVNDNSKKWRANNKEKRKGIEKKSRENMSDSLIISMIVKYTKIAREDVPPELIDLKRVQLKITRELRNR